MSSKDEEPTFSGPSWDTLSSSAGKSHSVRFTRIRDGREVRMAVDDLGTFNSKGFSVVCIDTRDRYVTLEGRAKRRGQPAKYALVRSV